MLRKITTALASALLLAGLTACGSSSASDDPDAPLKVAVNPVPHGDILTYVKDDLAGRAASTSTS